MDGGLRRPIDRRLTTKIHVPLLTQLTQHKVTFFAPRSTHHLPKYLVTYYHPYVLTYPWSASLLIYHAKLESQATKISSGFARIISRVSYI